MGSLVQHALIVEARELARRIGELPEIDRIDTLNQVKRALHEVSPFKNEPVDCVEWVPIEEVQANHYNPNTVAPPEMRLLGLSIDADGYTQPVVTFPENDHLTVVDGFHRSRIARENKAIRSRVKGHLPVVRIRAERHGETDRMASTIRHNRARGRHGVDEMSKIVSELTKKAWPDEKIAKELGMDQDEVLRLKQITGLAELFADRNFSMAWDIDERELCSRESIIECS
jgi:ParB-like chromosome segregation protein Spo0J